MSINDNRICNEIWQGLRQVRPINNRDYGWHCRGFLPHVHSKYKTQFITIKLIDAIPRQVLERIYEEAKQLKDEKKQREIFMMIENYLNVGSGVSYFKNPIFAKIAQDTLLFNNQKKYILHAWVVMSNHLHFLMTFKEGIHPRTVVHSIKSYIANQMCRILGENKKIWFPEYFDRYIRDREHYFKTVRYIERNPVIAKLCKQESDWRFSSAWKKEEQAQEREASGLALGKVDDCRFYTIEDILFYERG